jgi:RNA polymerase sigma-70 factor (ECF subfamily)
VDPGKLDDAFERQLAELYTLAKRPAMRVLSNPVDAEDVAAETLARLYLDWSRLVEHEGLKPWVVRVATNLAIDHVRRRKRGKTSASQAPKGPSEPDNHLVMVQAISRLPRRQR